MLKKTSVGVPVVCAAVGFTCFLAPSTAHALDLGAGLMGTVGGNFLDKPDRGPLDPDIYPGFGGLTIGGGLMLDARILDGLLGLEVDVLRTSDKGSGTITFNGYDFKAKIGQGAWHVPILAKVAIPSPLIAPEFFLGPELVFPSSAKMTVTGPIDASTLFAQTSSTYVMITAGLGMEIKLPLPILDLRIPIGLRGSYAPGISSKFDDRVKLGTPATYHSEWKFAVNFTAGAAVYF